MGQNTPEHIQSRTTLIQNWLPHESESNILVNKVTNEQVKRHFIKILIKDLPRQIALFASRMSNHQPYICRLFYFHPSVPDPRISQDHNDFRQMYLYTDKMLTLKLWTKQKFITILQGLRKLISIHGPFKISEGMICQNQNGEVKIWISQNPVNNHPDSKYMSEEQTVADIASILAKKNQDLASQLFGCHTLKDVVEKLSKTTREKGVTSSNYSHRASESGDFQYKKFDFIEKPPNISLYRNVFGQKSETQMKLVKNSDFHKQSIARKAEQDSKPTSNVSYMTKNQDNFAMNGQRSAIDETFHSNQTKKTSKYQAKLDFKNAKMESTYLTNSKSAIPLKYDSSTRSISKIDEGTKKSGMEGSQSPVGFQRFQTSNRLGVNPNLGSQKGLKSNAWQPHEPQSNFGAQKPQASKTGKSFCGATQSQNKKKAKQTQNITIINNNVSNFINNIFHNPVNLDKKKSSENVAFKSTKPGEDNEAIPLHSTQKGENSLILQKQKEKPAFIPNFIQQKKKINNFVDINSPTSAKNDNNRSYKRHDTFQSNATDISNYTQALSQVNLVKKQESTPLIFGPRNFERKTEKLYTFSRPNNANLSPFKYFKPVRNTHIYPKTPTSVINEDLSFSSFEKKDQGRNQYLGAYRTKTTQFHPKYREPRQRPQINTQNKSFTRKQTQKQQQKQKQYYELSTFNGKPQNNRAKRIKDMIQPSSLIEDRFKQDMKRSHTPEQKSDLKKQIRKQFNFLLGGESPKKEEIKEQQRQHEFFKKSEVKELKVQGGEVKQKIIKKKNQFAELKKQAQQLLI